MLTEVAESSSSSGDPVALPLAIVALAISLLAVLVPAFTGRQQRLRDDRAQRSEMYLELMQLVEGHGLWVVDRTYDLVETSDEAYQVEMPHRLTSQPERASRVRARAIVSAFASRSVSRAYSKWEETLESFERQIDVFAFTAREEGPYGVDVSAAPPLRDVEIDARNRLADAVNAQLVQDGRWRRVVQGGRWRKQSAR